VSGTVEDRLDPPCRTLVVESVPLLADLDHATRVHEIVRGEPDAALVKTSSYSGVCELVVRGTAHHGGAERLGHFLGQRPTQRAGGVHVEIARHECCRVSGDLQLRMLRSHPLDCGFGDIRYHNPRTGVDEVSDENPADLPDARHTDGAATQLRRAPHVFGRGTHTQVHAVGGKAGGIVGPTRIRGAPHDELRLPRDQVHVADVGPDVAGGDVATSE